MAIEVIATIKPKNNGDFPIVEATDISVDENGTRLDAFLGAIPKIIFKTQEEYDALAAAGTLEKDALYMIVEEDSV